MGFTAAGDTIPLRVRLLSTSTSIGITRSEDRMGNERWTEGRKPWFSEDSCYENDVIVYG